MEIFFFSFFNIANVETRTPLHLPFILNLIPIHGNQSVVLRSPICVVARTWFCWVKSYFSSVVHASFSLWPSPQVN